MDEEEGPEADVEVLLRRRRPARSAEAPLDQDQTELWSMHLKLRSFFDGSFLSPGQASNITISTKTSRSHEALFACRVSLDGVHGLAKEMLKSLQSLKFAQKYVADN